MKASELVELLKDRITEFGDREVLAFEYEIETNSRVNEVMPEDSPYGPHFAIMTDGENLPVYAFTPENEIPHGALYDRAMSWKAMNA